MSLLTFAELLDLLGHDDHVALCTSSSGVFSSQVVTAAHARVYQIPQDRDAWYSANPIQGPPRANAGRGDVAQVTRLASVYADLDVKLGGLESFDVARAVIGDLSAALHVRPSAVVLSGNGMQPYWPIEDEVGGLDAMALLRRWGRLVRHVAGLHGGKVDSVYDLTRILRIPGSFNHKTPPIKAVLCLPDTGHPVTVVDIEDALNAYNIPEHEEDKEQLGNVVSPSAEWEHGQQTCIYVRSMIEAWAGDVPDARHPWLVAQATRLAAAHRLGCITEEDHAGARVKLKHRFTELLTQNPARKETLNESDDAIWWGEDLISRKTDAGLHSELGDHPHAADQLIYLIGTVERTRKDQGPEFLLASLNWVVRELYKDYRRVHSTDEFEEILEALREAARGVGMFESDIDQEIQKVGRGSGVKA